MAPDRIDSQAGDQHSKPASDGRLLRFPAKRPRPGRDGLADGQETAIGDDGHLATPSTVANGHGHTPAPVPDVAMASHLAIVGGRPVGHLAIVGGRR